MMIHCAPPPAIRTPPPVVRQVAGDQVGDGRICLLDGELDGRKNIVRRFFVVDAAGQPVVRCLPEWNDVSRRRFGALAVKFAEGTLTDEEREELSLLRHVRNSETPSLSYEELVRRADVERTRERLISAMEDYARAKAAAAAG